MKISREQIILKKVIEVEMKAFEKKIYPEPYYFYTANLNLLGFLSYLSF